MDISRACMPPRQPSMSAADRAHPRHGEYMQYRAAMSHQLVEADSFALWLRQRVEAETPHQVVFQAGEHARGGFVPGKWYRRLVGLEHRTLDLLGPFDTEAEARG